MADSQPRRATLNDVARLAGVSYQTVSRVVNDHPNVASSTRSRVLDAIAQLDYRPNQAAKILATGRSHTLQLLIYDLDYGDPIPSMVYWAKELGYTMAVSEFDYHSSRDQLRETLETFAARMVDGIVLFTPFPIPAYDELRKLSEETPFVVAGTALGNAVPSVVFDQAHGTRLAVKHLLSLGHRHIAEISGPLTKVRPEDDHGHYDALTRHTTLHDTLRAAGLKPAASVIGNFTVPSGYEAANRLLEQNKDFTALFVANDRMALGALRALRAHGLRIPEDVSIVGFDDMPEAAFFEPPLTTVKQDLSSLSKECLQYLIDMIESDNSHVHQRVLYPELIVRESTRRVVGGSPG